MDYLGIAESELERAGGQWTAREISQQPSVWADVERLMTERAAALRAFLDPLLERPDLRIVLTGAGTSSFVGECLAPVMTRAGLAAAAVATTGNTSLVARSGVSSFQRTDPNGRSSMRRMRTGSAPI